MRKWNVLHVFYHYPPIVTGYAKRSFEIIKHTAPFSNAILIVPPIEKSKAVLNGTPIKGAGEEIYRLKKVPLPPIKHIGHRLVNRITLELLIRRVFKRHRIDLVHAHMPYIYSLPVMKYAKRKGIKCLYEVRGVWEDSAIAEGKIKPGSKRYLARRKGEESAMHLADKIVVLSRALKEDLIKRGVPEDKITYVGNAVDIKEFKPVSHSNRIEVLYHLKGKFVLGYVGTLRKMEGLQNLIQLIPKLNVSSDQFALLIVGHGEYKKELKKQVQDLGLEQYVLFSGTIPPEKINDFYSVMDSVVFPRESHRVTEIVSPLKPLEAMAMGKPVLASRVGGLTDYCIDQTNALLFDPSDETAFLNQIKSLMGDVKLRQSLGESAAKWVRENRNWETIAQKYQTLYGNIN